MNEYSLLRRPRVHRENALATNLGGALGERVLLSRGWLGETGRKGTAADSARVARATIPGTRITARLT
jgi:hypothetical protein